MKKEIIYIAVPFLMCLAGILFQSMFLSDTLDETQQVQNIGYDLSAKYYKDSLVQNDIGNIRKLYEANKRDSRSYGEVITDLLKTVETLLQKTEIEYKGNDINQDLDEVKNFKSGTTSFYINVNLTTSYNKIRNLLQMIERNELLINIDSVELYRGKIDTRNINQSTSGTSNSEIDEYNISVPVNLRARLEFVKFL